MFIGFSRARGGGSRDAHAFGGASKLLVTQATINSMIKFSSVLARPCGSACRDYDTALIVRFTLSGVEGGASILRRRAASKDKKPTPPKRKNASFCC